ncbi:MAG: hypothetical protein ACE148_10465 [Vicinamibacterales bacterium]
MGALTDDPGGSAGRAIEGGALDLGRYCRDIEAHLCARNHGRLIRIAGPTFDRVRSWAERGIPLAVVLRGIDRSVERYNARGQRRRPLLLDFCEADILDVFDEWRRAVGVRGTAGAAEDDEVAGGRRASGSLASHLERVIARLTALRAGAGVSPEWSAELERAARELDGMGAGAKRLRGEARQRAIERLEEVDRSLVASARARCGPDEITAIEAEAAVQLRPFEQRMPPEDYRRSLDAAIDRLVRDRVGLPTIRYGL